MSVHSLSPEGPGGPKTYNAYYMREVPTPDDDITRTGPGTPMGEYLRLYWQPVCLSEELTELPKAITIMGEKLVAFRDRGGRVGVLQRNCPHRGASLEFGIVQKSGIRCSYHGWLYDVDGRVLETPCEPAGSPRKDTVVQGAYPAFERDGLVFAYMGPPEKKPKFPEYDSYTLPKGTRLVPFSNIYPCNWLQVCENIMDHMHTAVLHNNMTVEGVDAAVAAGTSLAGFGDMPTMHWDATRNGNAMVFVAARRLPEDKVWLRISEMVLPNYVQIGSLAPTASRSRHSTTSLTRWHVPVDDVNMIIFGWRHFNSEIDPENLGRPQDCGIDKIDFLVGQTGGRSYEGGSARPGTGRSSAASARSPCTNWSIPGPPIPGWCATAACFAMRLRTRPAPIPAITRTRAARFTSTPRTPCFTCLAARATRTRP